MNIKKSELLKALDTVKPGLSNKEMIEQSTSFCFMNKNVVTYNDEISVSCPLDVDLEGAINATELYAFVNKIGGDEVEMSLNENNELVFKAGKSKAGLRVQSEVTLPLSEIGEVKKFKKLPDGFLKALKFCMGSCSSDMSRPVLTCVHVNETTVESSDGYRLANFTLSESIPVSKFLLPARICGTVIAFKPTKIAEGEGWIHFKNETNAILSCRVFSEDFPNTAPHLKVKGAELEFPKETKAILEKAMIFSKKDSALDESIKVTFAKGKMEIRSESGTGWFEEKARTNYNGDAIVFDITPYLLKDILSDTNKATFSDIKLLFAGENWKYLTLLRGVK